MEGKDRNDASAPNNYNSDINHLTGEGQPELPEN